MKMPGLYQCDSRTCKNMSASPTRDKWFSVELGVGALGTIPMSYYPWLNIKPFVQDHEGMGNINKHFCSWDCFEQTCKSFAGVRTSEDASDVNDFLKTI